ncbi:MAG: hypothetical protein KGM83_03485 [Betaproteobacteria bacterium]|nr:hypothetical protein [Betaproteobacteria bacterium]
MKGIKATWVAAAAAALLLSGCGGGGGGSSGLVVSSLPGSQAQGLYQGSTNLGFPVTSILLETGEFYNITSGGGLALTVDHGNLNAVGYYLTGTANEYTVASNAVVTGGVVVGSYLPQSAITGTIQYNALNPLLAQYISFSNTYLPTYTTPASLTTLAGTYSAPYLYGGSAVTLAISATGTINGTGTNCAISGTAAPRASGMNVYNVSLTLTGANCVPAGVGTASGVAFLDSSSGKGMLYMASVNSAGTAGFFWIAPKQ